MTRLSEDDLNELERLDRQATPRDWSAFDTGVLHGADWIVSNTPNRQGRIMSEEDAALIAAARNALPALLAEVRRLRRVEEADEVCICPEEGLCTCRMAALRAALEGA